ncbi:MAG: hypothetical protein MI807_00370 [Verrucomicrobiales bacterium]|nr:hypothetical protein [Verrucomicrobiales bacterium]
MKKSILISALLFGGISGPLSGQDNTAEELEKKARNVINNPEMQNLFRRAKKDPEAAAESVKENHGDLIGEAQRIFQEKKSEVDMSGIDTPENRKKIEVLKGAAMSKLGEATGVTDSETKPPATRSAAGATRFVTPIAMPVGETPTPIAEGSAPDKIAQEESVEPIAGASPTPLSIPDSPLLASADVPAPQPLTPRYNTRAGGGYQGADKDHMEIKSRESTMDDAKGLLTFRGNVVVDHPEFEMKCETLEIYLTKGAASGGANSSEETFKRAIASGGLVEIRKRAPNGKTQIAMARRADYNAVSKDIILSGGPPYIQDGDSFIETSSADAKIIMRGSGKFEITGSDAGPQGRQRIVIPIKGGDKTKGIGIEGLGGGIDRLR